MVIPKARKATVVKPLVSVVMATYNRGGSLARAINSILEQTFTDFEFIIVDDGSADKTAEVLHQYAKYDKRIRIIHQHNQGAAASRNSGIASSQGDYIACMDDDDFSLPKRLERQYDFLSRNPQFAACVCYYRFVKRKGAGDNPFEYSSIRLPSTLQMLQNTKQLKEIPRTAFVLSPMAMVKKEAFEACRGYRSFWRINDDLDFTLRFQERFLAGVVPEILFEYTLPSALGPHLTTAKPLNTLKCDMASYISAWFRRHGHEDPFDSATNMDKTLQMAAKIPLAMRRHILYHCLPFAVSVFLSQSNISPKELFAFFAILRILDNRSDLGFLAKVQYRKLLKKNHSRTAMLDFFQHAVKRDVRHFF